MTSKKDRIFARERVRWLVTLKRHENVLRSKIADIFDAETKYIVDNYEDVIALNGFSLVRELELKGKVYDAISRSIKKTMSFAVKTTQEQIKQEIKQDFSVESYILEWVSSEVFNETMTLIVTHYFDDVKRIISSGIEQQQTRREISKRIQEELQIGSKRALTIARTETHRAAMFASEKRANDISTELNMPMLKQWIPVSDGRTRDNHAAMRNAEPIPVSDMFDVGGEKMSRPNDPKGSGKNTINCRCVLRYIPQT